MDPIRTEMMKNRFAAFVEEASMIAYRTAHTTFIKQTQDYQCALATADGEIFAYPRLAGVSAFIGISLKATIDYIGAENLEPGDVIITNDPYGSDGLCSHTPDIHLLRPIFTDGRLIAFAWAFMHASDIGGAVPGTVSPLANDVFQEGIRLRPTRLYRRGKLNTELLNIFQDNCRIPDEVWGDLQAMLAALGSMDKRLVALCSKLGYEEVDAGIVEVMNLAEFNARKVIRDIPDGSYTFSDYIEGVYPGEFVFIQVTMKVSGDEVELDFFGSDPQAQSSINFVSGGRPHPFLTQALNYYILTVEPTTPMNAGIMRPMRTHAPRGTVMNAAFPAASGNRWVTVVRIYDAVVGCLNQAVPQGIAAAGAGQSAVVAVTARSPITGKRTVNVINPFCGGSGGRRINDGVDGVDGPQGSLKNTPTEIIEVETPIRIRQYKLEPGTFGAGQFRGGAAIIMDLENTELEAVMTARSLNRFHFAPWGIAGGHAGSLGQVILNPGRPDERNIGKITVLELKRGDVVRMITPSGGGFGNPFHRNPTSVWSDVQNGLLTKEQAESVYGVVIRNDVLDRDTTNRRRAATETVSGNAGHFAFGPTRSDYDRIWPPAVRAQLAARVLKEDPLLRRHLLARIRDVLTDKAAPVTATNLAEIYDQIRSDLLGGNLLVESTGVAA
jgi:N-methylhydantoinase B